MVNRKKPPPTKITTDIPFIEPQGMHLNNGLPVYYLEGGTEDIVRIEVVFFAGSFFHDKALTSFAAARLLRAGTARKSREEINELLDFYSAQLYIEAQKDIVSVSMFVLSKHLKPAFALLGEMITEATFPEDELRVFLKNQQQLHLINQKKVQHLAMTYFTEMIYGERHPYGYRVKTEDFEKLTRDEVAAFHRQGFHPGNAFCIISGKIPEGTAALVKEHLGSHSWTAGESSKPPVYPMLAAGRRKLHLDMPGAVQSAIRIGKQTLNRTHPAYHRLKITNALLGGFFGSRLMQNIRQEKGYTYGITSGLVSLVRSGYFSISTQAGTEVCTATVDEIYKELGNLRQIPAGKEELEHLKNYLSGSYLRSFDGPFMQAVRFKELLVFGLGTSHHEDFLRELKNISAEDIMETAGLYLREEEMMEVIAG